MNDSFAVIREVKKAVVGKDDVLVKVFLAILSGGHVLLEDIPGVGKTTLALAFSRALSLRYSRVQFTPDVLPSDITGYSLYNRETGRMEYQPGAILCNLFLADELNRATSRTQSALLEAMEEGQVTVDGVSRPVPQPFTVIATQNPAGAHGTQLLPDSQIDRFTLCLSLGYPSPAEELELLRRKQAGDPLDTIEPVVAQGGLLALREEARGIYMREELMDYIIRLTGATRDWPGVLRGASPRATLSVMAMAKATAMIQGRDYVIPADVRFVFRDTVAHRLQMAEGAPTAHETLREILNAVPAPRVK